VQQPEYDIVTVGGGVAGASLALRMAAEGARVLVLESSTQFRDRVRGEWLAPWGTAEARAIGLSEVLERAGAHELPSLAGRGGKPQPQRTPNGDVAMTFYHPRFQDELVDAAIAAGAGVIRGARVTDVTAGPSASVTYTVDGDTRQVSARLVVGADGRSSIVRGLIEGDMRTHRSARLLTGVRVGNVRGDETLGYFILREDIAGVASLFPQGEGFARAYVFHEGDDPTSYHGEAGFERFVEVAMESGIPEDVIGGATPEGPLAAFVADDSWVEHPAADGVALIGDAAALSDPTWGMGLALAFRDVRVLSDQLLASDDWNAAVHAYATEHDRHYSAIRTAENWHAELLLTAGPQAEARRRKAQRNWGADPSRMVDMIGRGPEADISEEARLRFFGEDAEAVPLG
jgi:2-polyprenyl-6-methoxyphenol hydroxylase-like FAD-dependent oxidoreductase